MANFLILCTLLSAAASLALSTALPTASATAGERAASEAVSASTPASEDSQAREAGVRAGRGSRVSVEKKAQNVQLILFPQKNYCGC